MAARIAGRQLQRMRMRHFSKHPLCVHCLAVGRVRAATQLDHIVAIDNGGVDTLDAFENRQGLCVQCHKVKSNRDLGHKEIGCDAEGRPTDPFHPWNLAKANAGEPT